jgi:hypothetical protein
MPDLAAARGSQQEAMYQPLGLECGHSFCADCAFSCVGKGRALGTVKVGGPCRDGGLWDRACRPHRRANQT